MKTQEELNQLKQEYQELNAKLQELSEEELKEVIGGINFNIPTNNKQQYEFSMYDDPNFSVEKQNFIKK